MTYAIVVTNTGPSDVVGATVSDTFSSALVGTTWTCTASTGASCSDEGSGAIADVVNIPVGGTLTYLASGVVAANAGDTLTNTASVTPPTGFTDSDGSDNTATDIDNVDRLADLSVTKDDGVTSVIGGGTTTYTIVVSNSGTAFAAGARVVDPLPSTVASSSWTCVASAGSACSAAAGTGAIDTLVDVAPNGTVTFMLTYTVLDVAGDLVNIVAVTRTARVHR